MAALFERMMETYILMERHRTPDGAGGFLTQWVEGARFEAALTMDTTMQARIAEKQGVTSAYTVTTSKNCKLEFHDVIKRVSDGRIFRITSDYGDKVAPNASTLDIAQVTAEKWELTA